MALIGNEKGGDRFREAEALHLAGRMDTGSQLERNDVRKVAEYELRQKRFHRASELFRRVDEPDRVVECLRRHLQEVKTLEGQDLPLVVNVLESSLAVGNWELLTDLTTKGFPEKIERGASNWPKQDASLVLKRVDSEKLISNVVLPGLAVSVLLPQDTAEKKKRVEEFLGEVIRQWQDGHASLASLEPRILGAAVERAGKDIQALSLYERIRDTAKSPSDKRYAEYRWVICKMRQAAREERDGFATKAASHRRSANDVMRKYGWGLDSVRDEFPDLSQKGGEDRPTTSPAAASSSQIAPSTHACASGSLGALEFRYVQSKGWINIDSKDGLRARVMMGAPQIPEGDVEFVVTAEDTFEAKEWDLHVRWISSDRVRFTLKGDQLDIVGS